MKTIRNHLKLISLFLSFTFLLQSCRVYQTKTATVDEAVQSTNRVKINSFHNNTYIFKELRKEGNQLYGIAKKNSKTAKSLSFQNNEEFDNSNYMKFLIPDKIIKEIHLQNKTMSVILPIAVSISSIIILGFIFQDSFEWGSGPYIDPDFQW